MLTWRASAAALLARTSLNADSRTTNPSTAQGAGECSPYIYTYFATGARMSGRGRELPHACLLMLLTCLLMPMCSSSPRGRQVFALTLLRCVVGYLVYWYCRAHDPTVNEEALVCHLPARAGLERSAPARRLARSHAL